MAMNSETSKVAMVVNLPKGLNAEQTEEKIKEFIKLYACNWFYILHDKDVKEDGQPKTPHFHLLFISADGKKHRLLYYINRMTETFGIQDSSPFSARIWKNYECDTQYLVHKNNPEKYAYPIEEVRAYDMEEFKTIHQLEVSPTITIERIKQVCETSKSLTECYCTLGLGTSQMYHGLIKDIYLDIHRQY